ncbi:hypothetical protein C3747_4g98 [Trypanosoma cruzi]|uniref:FYVE-type domain-containing protein n=3 Tax=Trypanosoma cruzi TaxID=5693 RepID=A0A2V2XJH0_TRYCR|nr:hypothetical protein C3747_4g98 [Trypanosoma cruzi]
MGEQLPTVGPSRQQPLPSQLSSQIPPLMFYDAESVLCAPVTPQQVISFNPREKGPPSRVMPDGSEYYGDLLLDQPHGIGIMLFKSSSSFYANGDRYGGGWKNGLFHGDGIFVTSSFTYQGSWFEGQMHGKGLMTYSRRITDLMLRGISVFSPFDKTHAPLEYRGDFHYRYHRHGHGIMRYANGDTYDGEWGSNCRHGRGRLITDDGEIYEGQWSKDERHGNGKITYVNGGEFKGSMVRDKRHGEGVMMFPNGDEYYGTFYNDKIEGHGTMRYKNGDVYEGMWKDGLRNGEGKYSLRKKGATVEGRFVNGLIQGRGVVRHPGVSTFVGEFDRGERRHGTLFWHDSAPGEGACYQGEWLGETMHNRGLLWYRNGDFYFGRFLKNKRHGPGNIRYADGGEYSGYFVNDMREGQGILQNSNGSIQAGMWHNDVFIEGYDGEWDGVTFNGIGHLLLRKPPACVPAGGSNSATATSIGTSGGGSGGDVSPTAATTSAASFTGMQPTFEHFGLFLHGVRHGAGVLRIAGHVIMGIWKHDVLSCETGSWEFPSGDLYLGGFKNGLREGPKGQMWFTDGSFFMGNWQLDAPLGNGSFYATDKREPIYAPEETVADATSPAAAEEENTHSSNYSGVMNLFINLFRRKALPENKEKRRPIGFREHFVLQGEWDIARLPYAIYQTLMSRLISSSSLIATGDGAGGGSEGGGNSGSNSGGAVAAGTLPSGNNNGSGVNALFKPPAMIPVGVQEKSGFVFFKSGICLRTEWLHNHPRLMLPHRPDAPLYNKIRGVIVTDDRNRGGTGGSKICSFCEKPFTFFRKETQCTFCEQLSCTSCLHPIEVRGRPKIEALLRLRMGQNSMNSDANNNNNAATGDTFVLPAQMPACVDCARVALLGLEFNVIWIPMHYLSVSETTTSSNASTDEKETETVTATIASSEASDKAENSLLKFSYSMYSSSLCSNAPYVVYEGYTCNCIPHIYGSLWWGKEGYYLGAFHEGRRHGRGVQMMANGEKYVGDFSNDEWHGMGIYCADDGSAYEGVWEHGKLTSLLYHGELDEQYRRHGRGQSYEADGSRYNGEWQHGQRHGTGILQMKDNVVYSGDFAFGRIEGEGKLLMETSVFYGSFHAGKKQGKGSEHFGDCVIEGEWYDDVLTGFVRIYDVLTETVYETTYQNGNERDDCFVPPVMVDDAYCQNCAQCHATFSLFLRRHHCRLCGEVVCDSCSQRRASMPLHFKATGTSRVCDRCYRRMEERRMLGIRRYANGEVYAGCWTCGRWVSRGLFSRADGSVVVMDLAGCPLVNGQDKTSFANTESKLELPLDASPPVEELRKLPPSSCTEVDAFTLWWSMMLSVAELSLPLELTPCRSFTLLRAPQMKPLRLFLEKDDARDDGNDDGSGTRGNDVRDAAVVRVARYIPSIAPPAPEPPVRLSDDSVLTSSPPPRPMITDSHIMRLVTDGRMEMFPAVPPPSADGNGVVMLSCYQRGPLLPPTPPRPSSGRNDRIMWDSWQTRPVPQYRGNPETKTQRGVADWQHVPFACPFLRPVVTDVDRAVRGGNATRWLPTPFVGPQVFTVKDKSAGGVLVEQKEAPSSSTS